MLFRSPLPHPEVLLRCGPLGCDGDSTSTRKIGLTLNIKWSPAASVPAFTTFQPTSPASFPLSITSLSLCSCPFAFLSFSLFILNSILCYLPPSTLLCLYNAGPSSCQYYPFNYMLTMVLLSQLKTVK